MFPGLWIVAVALLSVAGCADESASGPPEIQYGLEECGYCRMIISEEKFAAATVAGDGVGTTTRFDDVGCMVDYLRERASPSASRAEGAQTGNVWVHDHVAGGWIDAESAWFVRDPRGTTPMGSGWVAFASSSAAEAYAAAQGATVTRWAKVPDQLNQAATRNPR